MSNAKIKHTPSHTESPLGSIDWWLLGITCTILCLCILTVLSASTFTSTRLYKDPYVLFERQLIFIGIGFVALIICSYIPRKVLYKLHYIGLFFSFLFLSLITLSSLGSEANNAVRWLNLGPFTFQPMEFVKIALVLYLSYFFSTKQKIVQTFSKGVIPPFLITGLLCLLLLAQPDFGGAMIMVALLFFLCLVGGTRFTYLVLAFLMAVIIAGLLIYNEPYRYNRLTAFLDPFADQENTGYQLVQSFYAFAEGSFFGVGLGNGRQKIGHLPEAHNDFILAVIGEELGLLGVSFVMLLFIMLFVRCYRIIISQYDLRARLTSFGLTLILALGTSFNFAVVMGMVPPKGVPLPLLSYGGSSMLASMICLGLLLNFSRTQNTNPIEETPQGNFYRQK